MSIPQSNAFSTGGSPLKANTEQHKLRVSSAQEVQLNLARAMKGLWVGPMPVREFLDDFLPPAPTPLPKVSPQLFNAILKTKIEKEMYKPFVCMIWLSLHNPCSYVAITD